jgi:hypothetical protein
MMRSRLLTGAICFLLGGAGLALAASTALRPEVFIALPWTWSGVQSFNSGSVIHKGATSGTITEKAAAVAGSNTLTWPAGTTDFSATTGFVQQATSGAAFTVAAITAAQVPVTPLTTGTSVTLAAPRGYFVCTSTCTITVPVPAAGYEFCVRNDNNVATAITFAAIGSSGRYEKADGLYTSYGTAGTGTAVSTAAAGSKLCIVGLDSTHYIVGSYLGSWTMN